jgi:hypothetical protein
LEKAIICLAENKERDDAKPKWEQVNLEKRLEELGLAPFFPEEVCVSPFSSGFLASFWFCLAAKAGWPQINAVHQLRSKMKKAVKDSGDASWVPWVPFEIKKFLPDSFPEYLVVNFEMAEDKQPKALSRRLELAAWLAAWDGCV